MKKDWENCICSAFGVSYLGYLKGACKNNGEGLFTRVYSDRTRGNRLKERE